MAWDRGYHGDLGGIKNLGWPSLLSGGHFLDGRQSDRRGRAPGSGQNDRLSGRAPGS